MVGSVLSHLFGVMTFDTFTDNYGGSMYLKMVAKTTYKSVLRYSPTNHGDSRVTAQTSTLIASSYILKGVSILAIIPLTAMLWAITGISLLDTMPTQSHHVNTHYYRGIHASTVD